MCVNPKTIDLESVLGHESCHHFILSVPSKSAILVLLVVQRALDRAKFLATGDWDGPKFIHTHSMSIISMV